MTTIRLARRMLAPVLLLLLPTVASAQRAAAGAGTLAIPDASRHAAVASPLGGPGPSWFVRQRPTAVLPMASPGRQRAFVIGGAVVGAVVGGILMAQGKGLAPCGSGGTPAFCTAARVVVVGGSAGVGALLGYLVAHGLP